MALPEHGSVFSLDPGAEHGAHTKSRRGSGWCRISWHPDSVVLEEHGHIIGGPGMLLEALTGKVNDVGQHDPAWYALRAADRLVVEGFDAWNTAAKIDPLESVGMMRMYGALNGLATFVQRAGERTSVSHEDLHRIGMWPGATGHADTAQSIRHALVHLMKFGHRPTIDLVVPDPGD